MRFALLVNSMRDPQYIVRDHLISLIEKYGSRWTCDIEKFPSCNVLITLGGDGTFLNAAHLPDKLDIPTIGINLGSVGFLTEMEPDDIESALELLLSGRYEVESRMMLTADVFDSDGNLLTTLNALNDVVIARAAGARIVSIDLRIDGNDVERIPGDGIIVATPTGSTAYSLAAGGPIVHPSMELILITPVCPHSLHNRSYLAPKEASIELTITDPEALAGVSADGRDTFGINTGKVIIRQAERKFRLIHIHGDRFYQKLPGKIQQRGMIR